MLVLAVCDAVQSDPSPPARAAGRLRCGSRLLRRLRQRPRPPQTIRCCAWAKASIAWAPRLRICTARRLRRFAGRPTLRDVCRRDDCDRRHLDDGDRYEDRAASRGCECLPCRECWERTWSLATIRARRDGVSGCEAGDEPASIRGIPSCSEISVAERSGRGDRGCAEDESHLRPRAKLTICARWVRSVRTARMRAA